MTASVIIGPWPRATEQELALAREFVRYWRANISADMSDAEVMARLKPYVLRDMWPVLERALQEQRLTELQRRA